MDKDKLLRIYLKARDRTRIESYADAQGYALKLGDIIAKALGDMDLSEVSEDEISDLLRPVLRQAQTDAISAARLAQQAQNKSAKLGLGVLDADADMAVAETVAGQMAGRVITEEYIAKLVNGRLQSVIDETQRKNAKAQEDMGLDVHIVRKYSDLGLRSGTKYAEPCKWCLDRCGEWTNYQEAYEAGCFERHDGCCCQIDYDVYGTHTVSKDKWNWYNK